MINITVIDVSPLYLKIRIKTSGLIELSLATINFFEHKGLFAKEFDHSIFV